MSYLNDIVFEENTLLEAEEKETAKEHIQNTASLTKKMIGKMAQKSKDQLKGMFSKKQKANEAVELAESMLESYNPDCIFC